MKATFTDLLFCWTFSILGAVSFGFGLDTCLNSSYHGAGLMLALGGLILLGVSANESGKL
jgi:hypothetical protein